MRSAFSPAFETITTHRLAAGLDISVSVWVDGHGEVGSINPDLELFPASNQKLFTAVGALELLPPDHRFTTRTLTDSRGNLYLHAGGDPTLTWADVKHLAAETAAGSAFADIVIDASRFEAATMAPGWQDWHIPTYVGPLSALTVDDNRWTKDPEFVAAPALVNGRRFASQLSATGRRIDGEVREGRTPPDAVQLGVHRSAPVETLLRSMLLSSDNQIADALVREIGYIDGDDGSTSTGTAHIRKVIGELGLELVGDDGDGSGLSRANHRSAREWQQLLVLARDQPWFDQFYDALPVAGRSGTLSGRLTGPQTAGNVRAKTGTIIGGRSLSGYLTVASGHEAVFSIVVNGDVSHLAQGLIDNFVVSLAAVEVSN
ncbi:MAG: D-alanyl-D-alanine carboxypeptidase/D-alanyl-D-alanine-endopeptidase [Acidimicrobiales bacterium]